MPLKEKARIINNTQVGPGYFKLDLFAPQISSQAKVGQFVNVKCSEDSDPLLRRPFSFHGIDSGNKTITLLYELVGKGTKLLSEKQIGTELDILGPLGNGFEINQKEKIAVLVSGGIGIAPLTALAKKLSGKVKALYALTGCQISNQNICERDLRDLGFQTEVSTEDGSYGRKGTSVDLLEGFIETQLNRQMLQETTVYACGPKAMLKLVAEIAQINKIQCQLSMEAYMACGFGVCLGCAIKTKAGYKYVCKDGPVFKAEEIVWED